MKHKQKRLIKDVYFEDYKKIQDSSLKDPDATDEDSSNIPVALYVEYKDKGYRKYQVFIDERMANIQGLNVIAQYCDYKNPNGSSQRTALQDMLNDFNNNPQWIALIVDLEDEFSPGSIEHQALSTIERSMPVFPIKFVDKFKG